VETLDKLVHLFVEEKCQKEGIETSREFDGTTLSADSMKKEFEKTLKDRIIEEVISQKKKELDQYAKKKVDEERKSSSIAAIKELLWEGFILSIFVGLLGNELTTLIEVFKNFAGEKWHTIITTILIFVYAAIVLALYVIKFTKDIINTFIKKGR